MDSYPNISHMLRTVFNAEDGLSEDVAIRLYQSSSVNSKNHEELKRELQAAFTNPNVSWKKILLNDDYEVFDAQNEEEAREYAKRILWNPIFGA